MLRRLSDFTTNFGSILRNLAPKPGGGGGGGGLITLRKIPKPTHFVLRFSWCIFHFDQVSLKSEWWLVSHLPGLLVNLVLNGFVPSSEIVARNIEKQQWKPNYYHFCLSYGLAVSHGTFEEILFSVENRVVGSYTDSLLILTEFSVHSKHQTQMSGFLPLPFIL